MARPSKKKLLAFLEEKKVPMTSTVTYESFGRDTRAFIGIGTMNNRAKLERLLTKAGYSVDQTYWPGHPTVMVKISYLKAHGWNA